MGNMEKALRQIPLFSELTDEEITHLSSIAIQRRFRKQSFVFLEGQEREAVYFIQSGVIKVFKVDEQGHAQVISLLHKGDMFPHVGFFDEAPYPGTAEVLKDADLLAIQIEDFDRLLEDQPKIAKKVMQVMGRQLIRLQRRLQNVTSGTVQQRVVYSLIRLSKEFGVQKESVMHISLPITHTEFGSMVGASRESINRALNQLRKAGLLEFNRNEVLIYDMKALQNCVQSV
ncbi:MAG: Crp/Fnr family transcriptional regulator [Firmicutes bacterium]|uniref:CRP/FNR family transcriptional regulator, anaerobic regulatory protein n=1 Tax=Melghirimyces thermohalophilus TaxID=1236220 RepID=A0A1G6PRA4_9BACL|nr:Crp/Fnr family transcriptional regulator [Melghirimyces thermohalophilus]MDA8352308.1 Crp/Fnr family transcriptional regulator [Bacillota bacterium]SDC81887.1 CRP/FNR family transcriptional regulator, anaerobic regulatory protein [Melghirimyces thermohalophilus]